MGLGCCGTLAKYILFIVNFFVFLCGGVLLGVGLALLLGADLWEYWDDVVVSDDPLNDPLIEAALYTMIGTGSFLFLVGFLGCCGACKESKCLLMTYAVLIIVVILAEITGIILTAVFYSEISEKVEEDMTRSLQENYAVEDNEATTRSWDRMQTELECCGAASYRDYNTSAWKNTTDGMEYDVPRSCCPAASVEGDGDDAVVELSDLDYHICNNETMYYEDGCVDEVEAIFEEYSWIIMGVLAGIIVLQIISVCCAFTVRERIESS